MRTAKVTQVFDGGNDVLVVLGTVNDIVDDAGNPRSLTVTGWVSAMSNHFDPQSYGPDGHLLPGATARAMNPVEKLVYCKGLLLAQRSTPQPPVVADLGIAG